MKYKVIYLGSIGKVAEFLYFHNDFELIKVYCEQEKINSDLLTFSIIREIELELINNHEDLESKIVTNSNDVIFIVCSLGIILKESILLNRRFFNIHPSLLPKYKGRHPSYHATINNERYIGISIHEIVTKIDQGKIIYQQKVPYYYWMNESDIMNSLINLIPILLNTLTKYFNSEIKTIDNSEGDYFLPVTLNDKKIFLDDKPSLILNKVRAQSSYNGAILEYNNLNYGIKKANVDFLKPNFLLKDKLVFNGEKLIGIYVKNNLYIQFLDIDKL
jgi:methionyl-tRNA formyltransferase